MSKFFVFVVATDCMSCISRSADVELNQVTGSGVAECIKKLTKKITKKNYENVIKSEF